MTEAIEINHRTVGQALRRIGHHPDAAMWRVEYSDKVPTQGEVRMVLRALGHEDPTSKDRLEVKEIMRSMKLGVDVEAAQLVPSLTDALLKAWDEWVQPLAINGGPSVHPIRLLHDACRELQIRWQDRADEQSSDAENTTA